jgi:hypothetical protein
MSLISTYNYLVPAAGTTSAFVVDPGAYNANPFNFSQVSSNTGEQFNPSGVVIDNINGTVDVLIVIQQTGFQIKCPMGKQMGIQFPAPAGLTALITANGANIAFVDYPVIPYQF